jgi:hypothetical protein
MRTPMGITPPTPGLDREEPEFTPEEEDIPQAAEARGEGDDRPARRSERE